MTSTGCTSCTDHDCVSSSKPICIYSEYDCRRVHIRLFRSRIILLVNGVGACWRDCMDIHDRSAPVQFHECRYKREWRLLRSIEIAFLALDKCQDTMHCMNMFTTNYVYSSLTNSLCRCKGCLLTLCSPAYSACLSTMHYTAVFGAEATGMKGRLLTGSVWQAACPPRPG